MQHKLSLLSTRATGMTWSWPWTFKHETVFLESGLALSAVYSFSSASHPDSCANIVRKCLSFSPYPLWHTEMFTHAVVGPGSRCVSLCVLSLFQPAQTNTCTTNTRDICLPALPSLHPIALPLIRPSIRPEPDPWAPGPVMQGASPPQGTGPWRQ